MRYPLVAGVVVLMLVACGSGSDPSPAATAPDAGDDGSATPAPDAGPTGDSGSTGPVTREQYRAAFIAASCDAHIGCCVAAGKSFARDKCEAFYLATYDERKGATFDPQAASTCMRYLVSFAKAACAFNDAFDYGDMASCFKVFNGTVQPEEPCMTDNDCAAPRGKSVTCQTRCIVEDAVSVGGHCTEDIECLGGYCDLRLGAPPRCKALPVPPDACFKGRCATGNLCDGAGNCQPAKLDGDVCAGGQLLDVGAVSTECKPTSYCKAGTCAPLETLGKACVLRGCVVGLGCVDGKCVEEKVGRSCAGGSDEACPLKSHDIPSGVYEIQCIGPTFTCGGYRIIIGDPAKDCPG